MKKVWVMCGMLMMLLLAGCETSAFSKEEFQELKGVFIKDKEVKQLEEELLQLVKDNIEEHFQEKIHEKEFDIYYSEMVEEDAFRSIQSVDTKNDLYIIGTSKKEGKDILQFIMIYNHHNESIKDLSLLRKGSDKHEHMEK